MAGGATVAGADSGTVSMSGRATQLVPLGTKFYEHPLIRSLGQDITKRRPSYIPAGQFAEVVFDIVVEAGSPASPLRKAADRAEQDLQEAKDEVQKSAERAWRALLRRVEGLPQAKALDEALAKSIDEQAVDLIQKYPFLEPAVAELKSAIGFPPLLSQLRAGIDALQVQSPQFAQTLGILVTRAIQNTRGADEALAKARGNVEAWFDNSMQRLSGAYKRRVQLYAFMIGLMVALVANVDSVAILRTLWSDQGVRSALTVQAQQTIQAGQGAAGEQTADQILNLLGALRLPLGWTLITAAQDIADDTRCSDFYGSFYRARTCFYPASYDTATAVYRATVWQTVFGILLTAIATLQGSPFWFGVLSKIVNLRASTPPPAAQPVK
jgi:hypothetical protein